MHVVRGTWAAPGSERCTRHHLEAFTDRRALNRRRRLCGCGAQPDPGYRTCARCRVWAWWSKRCQRHPELRLDYRQTRFAAGYCDHGNAARAAALAREAERDRLARLELNALLEIEEAERELKILMRMNREFMGGVRRRTIAARACLPTVPGRASPPTESRGVVAAASPPLRQHDLKTTKILDGFRWKEKRQHRDY